MSALGAESFGIAAESEVLTEATEHQLRVRAALTAALRGGASHAYLLHGPAGAGKRAVARAFAAELLAQAAAEADAADTRRRALLDPSPHPDLVWVAPEGLQHRVEEIRDRVIRMSSRRPFEGGRRVFVIEQAEAMRDEAQNALLKTLEEPPDFVHLILISQAIEEVLPTVRSRCQQIEFAPLPAEVVERELRADPELAGKGENTIRAASRLAGGDLDRARQLAADRGQELRAAVEFFIASALAGEGEAAEDEAAAGADSAAMAEPWQAILKTAEQAGEAAEAEAQARLDASAEMGLKLSKTESGQALRREARRARTEVLDLALGLVQNWLRDLSALSVGAPELIHNSDRQASLQAQLADLREAGPRVGILLAADYRNRLQLNVSEELALEALHSELRRTLSR